MRSPGMTREQRSFLGFANFDGFARTFGCNDGDTMVTSGDRKIMTWEQAHACDAPPVATG